MFFLKRLLFLFALVTVSAGTAKADWLLLQPANKQPDDIKKALATSFPSIQIIDDISAVKPSDSIITLGNSDYLSTRNIRCKSQVGLFVSNVVATKSPKGCGATTLVSSEPEPLAVGAEIQRRLNVKTTGYLLPSDSDSDIRKGIKDVYPFFEYIDPGKDSIFRTLRTIYLKNDIDSIFIPSTHSAFDSRNVITALESIYRNRLPAVSNSRSLIGKGAVLVIYIEFNEVFKKLNELLDENGGTAPVGLYHASYRVFYDVKLAKVLGLEGVNE